MISTWVVHSTILLVLVGVCITLLALQTHKASRTSALAETNSSTPTFSQVLTAGNDAGGKALRVRSLMWTGNNALRPIDGSNTVTSAGLPISGAQNMPTFQTLGDVLKRGGDAGGASITNLQSLAVKGNMTTPSFSYRNPSTNGVELTLTTGNVNMPQASFRVNMPTTNMQLFNAPRLSRDDSYNCCVGNCAAGLG